MTQLITWLMINEYNVPTRWDSTFIMFERTLKLKTDLIVFASRYDGLGVEITIHEWNMMVKLLELLGLFHSITKN